MRRIPSKDRDVWPFLSVLIPCYNEKDFIGPCLDSVLANDYPQDRIEILVVDGNSSDGTADVLSDYARRDSRIRVLKNVRRMISASLNVGIDSARGEVVCRLDAHAQYSPRYFRNCVKALQTDSAASVGGVWKILPRKNTPLGRAIAAAYAHPFGIGNAAYRIGDVTAPKEVDTVPFFCCWTSLLRDLGPHNENLIRSEDMEFNSRLKAKGGRILLLPDVICYYYARSDGMVFLAHTFKNGVYITAPWLLHGRFFFSIRHIVPLFFSAAVMGGVAVGGLWPQSRPWVGLLLVPYAVVSLAASAHVAWVRRRWEYLFTMPAVFFALHFFYGLGSLWGIVVGLIAKWKVNDHKESVTL